MSTTSRRAVLAGAATLPALALPAIAKAAEPDPIFAAIERHRRIDLGFNEAINGDVEERLTTEQFEKLETGWWEVEGEALHNMIGTQPTTIPGVIALLAYVNGFDSSRSQLEDKETGILCVVAEALRNITGEARS